MLIKFLTTLLLILSFNLSYSAEPMIDAISLAINSPRTVNSLLRPKVPACMSEEEQYSCPSFFHQMLSENYKGGLVGVINNTVSDGELSTPDKVCKSSQSETPEALFTMKINANPQFNEVPKNILAKAKKCVETYKEEKLNAEEKNRAKKFILSSFVYKTMQLKEGYQNMLMAQSQLDRMLSKENTEDCSLYQMPSVAEYCRSFTKCSVPKSETFFNQKVDEIKNALNIVAALRKERRRMKTKGGDPKELQKIEVALENIYTLYPMIQNSSLRYSLDKKSDEKNRDNEIRKQLKLELVKSRAEVADKLKDLRHAESCIIGSSSNCNDVEKTLAQTAPDWRPTGNLPYEGHYSCLQSTKENRDSANKVLNDVALNAALALTPMGIIGGAKLLYQSGKLIKNASTLAKIKSTTVMTTAGGDVAIAGNEVRKVGEACESKLQVLQSQQQSPLNCEMQEQKVSLALDVSACNQQMIVAGLSTIFSGLGASGAVKLATVSKDPVNKIINVLGKDEDKELAGIIENYFSSIKNSSAREQSLSDLQVRLGNLARSKEYTSEEIRDALKVYLKRCGR